MRPGHAAPAYMRISGTDVWPCGGSNYITISLLNYTNISNETNKHKGKPWVSNGENGKNGPGESEK
jgi:hypothetical protein